MGYASPIAEAVIDRINRIRSKPFRHSPFAMLLMDRINRILRIDKIPPPATRYPLLTAVKWTGLTGFTGLNPNLKAHR
jgi:hypothetical protein